jgi:hypothetical protein
LYKVPAGIYFRQIIKLEKIDACGVIANCETFPGFKDLLHYANMTLPGLIKQCPYKGVSFQFLLK